jgi:hypothetical protein
MDNPFNQEFKFSTNLFVGRRREILGTLDRLTNPQGRVSSAIHGEIGIGKSWLLERLKQPDLLSEWEIQEPEASVIPLNCREIDPWSAESFWQTIFDELLAKNIPTSEQAIISDLLSTSAVDNLLIGQLLDQIAQNGRFLILLLDNFDWIIKQMDLEDPAFLNVMRSFLVRERKGLGIVLTTVEPLHALCKPIHFSISPFDNVFYPVELKCFTEGEANDFIEARLKNVGISFTEEEKQRLLSSAQGHPDHLREASYQLFIDKVENVP